MPGAAMESKTFRCQTDRYCFGNCVVTEKTDSNTFDNNPTKIGLENIASICIVICDCVDCSSLIVGFKHVIKHVNISNSLRHCWLSMLKSPCS